MKNAPAECGPGRFSVLSRSHRRPRSEPSVSWPLPSRLEVRARHRVKPTGSWRGGLSSSIEHLLVGAATGSNVTSGVIRCPAMKIETAHSLAATAQEGMSVTQVKNVIDAFVDAISRCPVCDRSGVFIFGRNTAVDLPGVPKEIPAGTRSTCPSCGDPASQLDTTPGDREFFGWHCFRGDSVATCHSRREGDDPAHVMCGDRVLLALPGTSTHDVPRLLDSAR